MDEVQARRALAGEAPGASSNHRAGRLPLPGGYRIAPAGEIESRQESFGGIGSAIIVALFLTLATLVLEFRTFRSTLIVASVIPLGIVGGLLALWLAGETLSFTASWR